MCEIQLQTCCGYTVCNPGRLEEAAARWRPCRQHRAQITIAWAAAKSWDSAITQPTNTPRAAHGHSSQTLSTRLSLVALRSVERDCNTHCWPLPSIIHVLLLK